MVSLKNEEFVFREGDQGSEFYVIEKGSVQCLKDTGNGEFKLIRTLIPGEYFGELALLNNEPRSLSIQVCSQTCSLHKLDRETF